MTRNTLWGSVDRLAKQIAESAMASEQAERIEALKALTAYRTSAARSPKPIDDADAGDDGKGVIDFPTMKQRIEKTT